MGSCRNGFSRQSTATATLKSGTDARARKQVRHLVVSECPRPLNRVQSSGSSRPVPAPVASNTPRGPPMPRGRHGLHSAPAASQAS